MKKTYSYRVVFLTGAPLNLLSTRSHVNWLIISLSARDCKEICTWRLRGAPVKKTLCILGANRVNNAMKYDGILTQDFFFPVESEWGI